MKKRQRRKPRTTREITAMKMNFGKYRMKGIQQTLINLAKESYLSDDAQVSLVCALEHVHDALHLWPDHVGD